MRYVAQRTWPAVSRQSSDIARLFGPDSVRFQNAVKSMLQRPLDSPPICSLDLEFNPERPTVLGLSDGVLHVSVTWDAGRPHLIELLQRHPDIYWIGHFLISADVQVLAKEGIALYRQNVTDSAIWHYLTSMHLCKGTGKTEDGHDKRGKGYMNLFTYASLNTSLRNWKECPGEDVCSDGRPCPDHNEFDYNGIDAAAVIMGLPNVARKARLWRVDSLHDLHRDLLWAFQDSSNYGVLVDMPYVDILREELRIDKERIASHLSFNPASPSQVIQHFKKKGIALEDAQEETVRKAVESGEGDDELELLLEYKEAGNGPDRWFKRQYRDKHGWWKGFVDAYDRIHCRLGIFTSSGRMMAADPNLNNVGKRRVNRHQCNCAHAATEHIIQIVDGKEKKVCVKCECKSFKPVNVGKKLRRAIIASPGSVFVDADYKNGENMVYLYLAGYRDVPDEDFHTWMAGNIGIDDSHPFAMKEGSARDAAKTVTHAQDYGEGIKLMTLAELRTAKIRKEIEMGARLVFPDWTVWGKTVTFTGINLARRALGKASLENRKATLEIASRYMDRFPGIRDLQMRITAQIEREGGVRPPHGYFTRLTSNDEDAIKSGLAIYGSQPVAHLLKLSFVDLSQRFHEKRNSRYRVLLPIHDELLGEWPADADPIEGCKLLKDAMERETPEMPGFRLKAEPAWGGNWRDLVKGKL